MPRTKNAKETPLVLRAAILTLHLFTSKSWIEISTLLQVHPDTARHLCKQVKEMAANPDDTRELYSMLEKLPIEKSGRPEVLPEGSQKSQALGKLATKDKEHWEKSWPEIAKELGVTAARSTIEKVMHNHHNLARLTPVKKPPLSLDNQENRLDFAYWAIQMKPECFVYSDEMYIEINAPRGIKKITRPIGSNPFDYATHERLQPKGFRFMVWGCIAYGYRGPLIVWEKETEDEKNFYNQMVAVENQAKKERERERQKLAKKEGTREHQILAEININLRKRDLEDPLPSGRPRMKRRAEWEFKEEIIEWGDRSNGGIDWVLYREKILRPFLYPFVQKVEQETGLEMWLVGDNAGAHSAAQKLGKEEREILNIKTVNWPSNSPDINKIEPLWNYLKDSMAQYDLPGQSKATKEKALHALQVEWEKIPIEKINSLCLDLKGKLELVIKKKGNNNFQG